MGNKATVIGASADVLLWGFKCVLKCRRSGKVTDGYIVVTGNEEYELEEAKKEIYARYGALGYEVKACEYNDGRIWHFDALELFRASKSSRCATCEYYIPCDNSVGQCEGCEVAEDETDDEDGVSSIEREAAAAAFDKQGRDCEFYRERKSHKKKSEEPDSLAEIMAAIDAELDRDESEVEE